MRAIRSIGVVLLALFAARIAAQDWQMQEVSIPTRWAAAVSPTHVWPEYPRPQLQRATWQSLNGLWEYAITSREATRPRDYVGHILVPYPVESALSGVKKPLRPDQLLWYRRTVDVAPIRAGERLLLHFGAVDYEATVYLNGKQVGAHSGGYQNFTVELTDAWKAGSNELVVRVYDPTETGPNPHGKQNVSLRDPWMFYSASSGIWQTVWLERVPATYIQALKMTPDIDRSELRLEVSLDGERDGYVIEAIAKSAGKVVARKPVEGVATLRIDPLRLWSPDDPHLYDLQVRLLKGNRIVDEVNSYFGMRKIEVKEDDAGRARIYLNNHYTYSLGVADQGYWPDGLYTAPSDAALKFDVQAIKALGFNTVRKHIKIEPQRWYYHCDQLGLMVVQDMPSSRNDTSRARVQFEQEIKDNISQLHNHPSITAWVLFNEGWGAYDQERLAKWMEQADPSRLLIGHSGPYDQVQQSQMWKRADPSKSLQPAGSGGLTLDDFQLKQYGTPANWMVGNVADMHFYPGPRMFPAQPAMASVLGEHGSFGVYIEGHVWDEIKPVGRGVGAVGMSPQQMLQAYAESTNKLKTLEAQGLSGSTYFEIFDVEGEQQGFLTYDRQIAKVPVQEIERLNATLVHRAKNYDVAMQGFSVQNADWTSESERYARRQEEFRKGRRDPPFLARLALMAHRQSDITLAREVGDAFVENVPRPYSAETWRTIAAITRSSKDKGFELFRTQSTEVNAALGPQSAEKKVLEIIQRELIVPYFRQTTRTLDWDAFETTVAEQYGDLGREAVRGAKMMDFLIKEDWIGFGRAYAKYFETAISRSPYWVHSLSYRVLAHVDDPSAIETAVRVMKWRIDSPREAPVFGRYDPVELDTYANLLYALGRKTEALHWQQMSVVLSDGRDPEIIANLRKMSDEALTHNFSMSN